MEDRYYPIEDSEELMPYVPEFDSASLPRSIQRRIGRYSDSEKEQAEMDAIRSINRSKVSMVAMLCQGHLDDAVTLMIQRNPRRSAAANLIYLSEANADCLYDIIHGRRGDRWR